MKSAVDLYDYIYSWKDYAAEADIIHKLLSSHGCPRGRLVEFACGTGRYIENLSMYQCYGVDLCPRSIALASQRVPAGQFSCEDMKKTTLKGPFDAALCLFGGIAYLDEEALEEALLHWHSLLRPEGILMVEPWLAQEQVDFNRSFLQTYQTLNFKVARMVVPKEADGRCVLNFKFLIARAGFKVEMLACQDSLWLYNRQWLQKKIIQRGFKLIDTQKSFLTGSILMIFSKV